MFIFISRLNNVCEQKSCGNITRFPKKIQFYNCQIYWIALLTPKAKTNPLGKVETDRRKYLERAEISETTSLMYIRHSLFAIKFFSALWGNYLQIPTPISAPAHFFFRQAGLCIITHFFRRHRKRIIDRMLKRSTNIFIQKKTKQRKK